MPSYSVLSIEDFPLMKVGLSLRHRGLRLKLRFVDGGPASSS
jgi:hypothetical protein